MVSRVLRLLLSPMIGRGNRDNHPTTLVSPHCSLNNETTLAGTLLTIHKRRDATIHKSREPIPLKALRHCEWLLNIILQVYGMGA